MGPGHELTSDRTGRPVPTSSHYTGEGYRHICYLTLFECGGMLT